jgi:hypothetical protein
MGVVSKNDMGDLITLCNIWLWSFLEAAIDRITKIAT